MSSSITVFINEKPVEVGRGSTVADAVARLDPDLATAVRNGTALVTDGVGRALDAASEVSLGAIVRVVRVAPRSGGP